MPRPLTSITRMCEVVPRILLRSSSSKPDMTARTTISVMALIVVLAVMSGFEDELRSKILGTTSHILVMDVSGRGIQDPAKAVEIIRADPEVRSAAPFVLQQVMLSHGESATGVVLRGIDPEAERRELQVRVKQGNLGDLAGPQPAIALGRELARTLGAFIGDEVVAISPRGAVTAVGTIPKMRPLRVVAVFEIGLYEYDSALAYTSIETAQQFAEMGGRVSGIEVRRTTCTRRAGCRGRSARSSGCPTGPGTGRR